MSAPPERARLSFSAFLMDGPGAGGSALSASPSLPPLRAPIAVRTVSAEANGGGRGRTLSGSSAASAPRSRANSASKPPLARRSEDDIPVLEMRSSGVNSDLDMDMEEESDDEEEDDEDGNGAVVGVYDADEDDFVPVLQTAEDAARTFSRTGQQIGSKKFSWRESTRRVTRRTRPHSGRDVAVPDSEMLLRMSTRSSEFATSYQSSNSVGSRKSSLRVDRQIVRKGWLFKQAQVMKTWKRRYFVLIKRTNLATGEFWASLQYYKGSNFGKLRGEMHLQDKLEVRFCEPDETKRPFCFEVVGQDFSFVCQASDDDDVSAWVCLIQSLSGNSREMPAQIGTAAAAGLRQAGVRGRAEVDARSIRIVAELRRLLHTSKSPEAAKFKSFTASLDVRSLDSLRQLREFHASMTESIMKDHTTRILASLKEPSASSNGSASNGAEKPMPITVDDLRAAVSRHIEEVLFVPLQEKIGDLLHRLYQEDEASINRKVRWLQGKDQSYFNIPLHHVSWKEWRQASKILARIAAASLPASKYDVLAQTIEEIQVTFAEEHNTMMDLERLETDDLIPIFTYVLSNSGVENLISLKALLTELNGSWAVGRSDDDGAVLSILNHAVEFIGNVSIPAVLEDIFKDQITLSIDGDWRRVLEFEVEPTYRYGAVVQHITPHGYSNVGTIITRGYVLVTVNGQNVVLWPYQEIMALLLESRAPHRLAFIPGVSYFKILTANKSLWNVALMNACQRGDVFSVQMLLANGADVNYVAHECGGNTPLHIAVSELHFNVVSYLLQHGAKVKTIGELGRSALHMVGRPCTLPSSTYASKTTSETTRLTPVSLSPTPALPVAERVVNIIKKLLAHSAPVDTVDIYGNTPIMLLAEKGYLIGIDTILDADSNLDLDARNWQSGMSAIAFAAKEGHADVVEGLLDYGAQADVRTLQGETPLHFAAGGANKQVCELLIDRGCDVNARTRQGVTPLMVAVSKGAGLSSSIGRTASVVTMTTASANVRDSSRSPSTKERSKEVRSSIHVDEASVVATVAFLIDQGADINAACDLYRLPLHYAAMHGGPAVYSFLLSKLDPATSNEIRDLFGQTPAAMLAMSSRTRTESNGSMPNSSGRGGFTFSAENDTDNEEQGEKESEDEPNDDDDDDDDEDTDELVGADIPRSLKDRTALTGKALSIKDLITEEVDGVEEVIAGTFDGILDFLLRYDNFRKDELMALIVFCGMSENYRPVIDFLRDLTRRFPPSTTAGRYVRRFIFSTLNTIATGVHHSIGFDAQICDYVFNFWREIFPFDASDDPQCYRWVETSVLRIFAEACETSSLHEFQVLTLFEDDYTSVKNFICSAKQRNSSLTFLDDDLFAPGAGMEIISETMRRRLSIAGVWGSGDPKKSFVVKPEDLDRESSETKTSVLSSAPTTGSTMASTSTITPWQPRGVNVGRLQQTSERPSRTWILEVDPNIIAQQITVFQHYLFSRIKVSEILASKRNADKTPGYQRLKLLHNHISLWVIGQILARSDVDQRAEMLAHFIRVAGALLSPLQNFDGFMAIMNAANDSSIYRLKKTWSRLPAQARDQWHELKKLTEKGARALNKLTKELSPPLIPYMGVLIQNVLALQEFPDHVEGELINFKKIRSIHAIVVRMLAFQRTPYLLPVDKRILDHLCSSVPFGDPDACFKRSLKIEPRVESSGQNGASR